MNQRAVTIIATYLAKRPLGRLSRVRSVGTDDYILAIEDVRDGRTHLIHSAHDFGVWLKSFEAGRCLQPAAAICGRCYKLHVDRDADGELLGNCMTNRDEAGLLRSLRRVNRAPPDSRSSHVQVPESASSTASTPVTS